MPCRLGRRQDHSTGWTQPVSNTLTIRPARYVRTVPGRIAPGRPDQEVDSTYHPVDTAGMRADSTMSDRWMTYADAAVALRMTPESIRARARREHWRKQLGNDGKALILVPVDAEGIPPGDTDGDTNRNCYDPDSDDDLIPDNVEGLPNADVDADSDRIHDSIEGDVDTNKDGVADRVSFDSDSDGLPDRLEGTYDGDKDKIPDFRDDDSDADKIPDPVEGAGDPDGDRARNFRDTDSDGDGKNDADEGQADADSDGAPDYIDA